MMTIEIKETERTYEVSDLQGWLMFIVWIMVILIGLSVACYLLWSEYKLEKGIVDETYAHNGSCIDKGIYRTCSYQGDTTTIINSKSTCFINDVEVNCSEIER